jgi:hypothetical protein
MRKSTLALAVLVVVGYCALPHAQTRNDTVAATLDERRVAILNRLRNEINATYGFMNGVPRINLGPCGRFAKLFREQWNTRFRDKINIVFVMVKAPAGPFCGHIVVRLPDGSYFDGGNGVVSGAALGLQFPESYLEEMKQFDLKRLDQNAGGLDRKYETCPNYSDTETSKLIERYLILLPRDIE